MSKKDVIYIDIEDDITSIIDKVKASKSHIVALVPPKRSTVLQSAVNMKLLKKAGTDNDKKVVIISSERSLMPLAGGVGLFMADSLQSRPEIPEVEDAGIDDSIIEDDGEDDHDLAKGAAVGAAAGVAAGAAASKAKKSNKKASKKAGKSAVAGATGSGASEATKESLKGKSKIPNFQKFRWRLIFIIGGIILLIILWFVAFKILPSATVTVKAQTTRVPTDTSFVADSGSSTNIDEGILSAQVKEITRTETETFEATGEKDDGKKASGSMTIQNCYSSSTLTVPSGTVFTDQSTGFRFTSNSNVKVGGAVFEGGCKTPGEASVDVTAVSSGDDKNLSARNYSVPGYSGQVTGFGDQMTGGTTKIVKVVSQNDIDKAINQLLSKDHNAAKDEVAGMFDDNAYALTSSFTVSNGDITADPTADTEANTGTVSGEFSYKMLGVQKDSLNQYLEKVQKDQLGDQGDQQILDTGLDSATIDLLSKSSDQNMTFTLKTNGFAGPELDEQALKEEIKGKRYSEAIAIIEGKDGVNSVEIELSPFYVSSVPSNTSNITINVEVSDHTLQ